MRALSFLALAAIWLLSASQLSATTVNWLSGGPNIGYPSGAGHVDGDITLEAEYNTPCGLVMDSSGNYLYLADRENNQVRILDFGQNYTFDLAPQDANGNPLTNIFSKPVGLALDAAGNTYVLNRANNTNGTVLKISYAGILVATNLTKITNAAAIALDSGGNIFVTASNRVFKVTPAGVSNIVATIPGAVLQGIVVKHNGLLAVCDSAQNGIYLINPNTGLVTTNAGFHGAGDFFYANNVASSNSAKFFQPAGIAEAGDGTLIVADQGNGRVKAVLASGAVTNIYGVTSSDWIPPFPGFQDGTVVRPDQVGGVAARLPNGVTIGNDGTIYVTEDYYHIIRKVTGTGLLPPLPPPPTAPSNLAATASYGQVTISWSTSTSTGVTNYNIKRSSASGTETTIISQANTTYTDTNIFDGITYYYEVSAVNTSGEGANSAEVSAIPLFSPAPHNLTVIATNYNLISLGWSLSAGATSYNIRRSTSATGPFGPNQIIGSAVSPNYQDTSVINGVTYYYVISAVNSGGENTNLSSVISAIAPMLPLADPKIGYVQFPATANPANSSVFSQVFENDYHPFYNDDANIIINGAEGTLYWTTNGSTPSATNFNGQASAGYADGSYDISKYLVSAIAPTLTVQARAIQSNRQSSAVVKATFQFVTRAPTIIGNNAFSFIISEETTNAVVYYTTNGQDPINIVSSSNFLAGTVVATTNGLFLPVKTGLTALQSDTTFKFRAFKNNYLPSDVSSQLFTKDAFRPNLITFGVGVSSNELHTSFIAYPGQFFYAPVVLQMSDTSQKVYSLQFNAAATNGCVAPPNGYVVVPTNYFLIAPVINGITNYAGSIVRSNAPAIANGNGFNFFSMLMTKVPDKEGKYFPPANGSWYLPIPNYTYTSSTNSIGTNSIVVNSSINLIQVGWFYRSGIKYGPSVYGLPSDIDFDTATQDLIAYSIAHDTLFNKAGGTVVLGAYAFPVPTNASRGDQYFIQLGSASATTDGVGAPGAGISIVPPALSQTVTVGTPSYIVGDVAPFQWLNAGDFGDYGGSDLSKATNGMIDNADVQQIYQATIIANGTNIGVNMPPRQSDFYSAMDSCGAFGGWDSGNKYYTNAGVVPPAQQQALWDGNDQTINNMAFGDGNLDINDLYVTFRRSEDSSLNWFKRYWTNGQFVAVTSPNTISNNVSPHLLISKAAPKATANIASKLDYTKSFVTFTAGDTIANANGTISIPINAKVVGDYPLRILGLNLTVVPLDGSPDLTQSIQFNADGGLGQPTAGYSGYKGNNSYFAAWLNSNVSGLTSNSTYIGTLIVSVPTNATSSSAYAVHFDKASGSPNGLAVFPKSTLTGLITLSNRTNTSYYSDGIPDSWRLRWFGTIYNNLSQSNACPAGDGISCWKKYVAGVDPNTANNFPSVSSKTAPAGSTSAIHWPSVSGKQYVIQRSSSLFPGTWSTITTNTGTGSDMEFDDNNASTVKFYRVLILP